MREIQVLSTDKCRDWDWGLGEQSSSFSGAVLSCDPSACGDALVSGAYSSIPERRLAYGGVAQQILRGGLCLYERNALGTRLGC
jgi:hypothetical protein